MRSPVRLTPGMWVGFEEQRHQVTGFVDGMVRLRSETGVGQLILAGELLGHASLRPCVDSPAEPDPGTAEPDLGALLDGLSKAQQAEVQRMQAHLLEMTIGFRSGQAASALPGEPRAAYDPSLTLQTRVAAKAAELGCGAAVMWKRLQRWRERGLAGLIDRRTMRLSNPLGGADPRLIEAILAQHAAAEADDSTGDLGRLRRRVQRRLDGLHGPGVVKVPPPSTFNRYAAASLWRLPAPLAGVRGTAFRHRRR